MILKISRNYQKMKNKEISFPVVRSKLQNETGSYTYWEMRRKVDIMSPSQDFVHLLTVGVWGGEEMRDIERLDSTKVTIMFRGKGSVR